MKPHVYHGFSDWTDVARQFEFEPGAEPEKVYALYVLPSYEGDATVVFKRDGQWKLAAGAHCSCYGLEGQWEPEDFDPAVHLAARAQGKTIARMDDYEGDNPGATQAAFDEWLAWAVKH